MSFKVKVISHDSEPTEASRPKRFVRKNSYSQLSSRSGSLKKSNKNEKISQNVVTKFNPEQNVNTQKNTKLHTETQKFFKQLDQPLQILAKAYRPSTSMRLDNIKRKDNEILVHRKQPTQKSLKQKQLMTEREQCSASVDNLKRQLQIRIHQNEVLASDCKRLKASFNEQRQRRKSIEYQIKQSLRQIKILWKKIQKYKSEKQALQKQIQELKVHIGELQTLKFDQNTLLIQSYREKCLYQEITKLRAQINKQKDIKYQQLEAEIEKINNQKYNLLSNFKSLNVANQALVKQLQQAQNEIEYLQKSMLDSVIHSQQYISLRERYRRTLLELKELRNQVQILQNQKYQNGLKKANIDLTILNLSQSMINMDHI